MNVTPVYYFHASVTCRWVYKSSGDCLWTGMLESKKLNKSPGIITKRRCSRLQCTSSAFRHATISFYPLSRTIVIRVIQTARYHYAGTQKCKPPANGYDYGDTSVKRAILPKVTWRELMRITNNYIDGIYIIFDVRCRRSSSEFYGGEKRSGEKLKLQ